MRFVPPEDKAVMIGLLSGHTCIIPPEGIDLEPRFRAEAIKRGCRPAGFSTDDEVVGEVISRRAIIKAAITAMVEGASAKDFTSAGEPSMPSLQKAAGFAVSREERDSVWKEMTSE